MERAVRHDGLARFALASALLHALAVLLWLDHGLGRAPEIAPPSPVRVHVLASPAPPTLETAAEPPPPEPQPRVVEPPPPPKAEPAVQPEPIVEPPPARVVEPPPPEPIVEGPAPEVVEPPPPEPLVEAPPEPALEVPPAPALEPARALASVAPVAAAPPPSPGVEVDPFEAYVELVRARIESRRHYPALARRRGIEGDVTVRLRVDAAGELREVDLVGSESKMLVDPTLEAVRRAGPFPAPPEGLGWIQVSIRYRMDD